MRVDVVQELSIGARFDDYFNRQLMGRLLSRGIIYSRSCQKNCGKCIHNKLKT